MLFADKTIIYGPISFTPFYIVYSKEAILLVETYYLI